MPRQPRCRSNDPYRLEFPVRGEIVAMTPKAIRFKPGRRSRHGDDAEPFIVNDRKLLTELKLRSRLSERKLSPFADRSTQGVTPVNRHAHRPHGQQATFVPPTR